MSEIIIFIDTEVEVISGNYWGKRGIVRTMGGGKGNGDPNLGIRLKNNEIISVKKSEVTAQLTCRGCGFENGGEDCKDCSHFNWAISCGCDNCGDHLGCSKQCSNYGCAHPRGLDIGGSLDESEMYSDQPLPNYIIERALEQARINAKKKFEKKMLKLKRIELSLTD